MKEIKKEIQKVEYETVFVATDGTEFSDKAECEKYEKSAKGVLMAKYRSMVIAEFSEEEIFGVGCDDNDVEVVFVKDEKVADLLLQIYLVLNPFYLKDEYKEHVQGKKTLLENSIGDYMLIGRGYDEDSFWFHGSKKQILKNIEEKLSF